MARLTGYVEVVYEFDEEVPDGTTLEDAAAIAEDLYANGGLLDVLADHEFTNLVVTDTDGSARGRME